MTVVPGVPGTGYPPFDISAGCRGELTEGVRVEWRQRRVGGNTVASARGDTGLARVGVETKGRSVWTGIFFEGCINNNPQSPGSSSLYLIKS